MDRQPWFARTDPHLARLMAGLAQRIPELSEQLADVIRGEVEYYRVSPNVSVKDLRDNCRIHLEFVLSHLGAGRPLDTSRARGTGVRRAAAGVPMPVVMDAYRVGSRFLWDVMVEAADNDRRLGAEALVAAASDIWGVQDSYTEAMTAGYRDELTMRLVSQEHERSAMVAALLEGRLLDSLTQWEIAQLLRIAPDGPHVVLVAEVPEVGRQALPGIENRLRAKDIASAWRLLPDLEIGIAGLAKPEQISQLTALIERSASGRVGLSPPFDDLAETASALRLARIALSAGIPGTAGVIAFDQESLAVASVSNPDVMQRFAQSVLGPLDDLSVADRALLLDTLQAWLDNGGSAAAAGGALFCHPNTVRHRLRRIEERTGRSLSDPRDVTQLCLALETERRFPRD